MKDSKTKSEESTRLEYTGLRHSCCHIYLDTLESTVEVVYYESIKLYMSVGVMKD